MNLHINSPRGSYCAQVRGFGCRKWKTVSEGHATPESALGCVADCLTGMKRGRVLFIVESGYYEPSVILEVRRA